MRWLPLVLLLAACGGNREIDVLAAKVAREREATLLVGKIDRPGVFERMVGLGEAAPLRRALDDPSPAVRGCAAVALHALGETVELDDTRWMNGYRALMKKPVDRDALMRWSARVRREQRIAAQLDGIETVAQLDALGDALRHEDAAWPLAELTRRATGRLRLVAIATLGRAGGPVGDPVARDRLLECLAQATRDPHQDGPTKLYAAGGLTLLADSGTAIDLLLQLSRINPDDNIAQLAEEGRSGPYYPVDAQICDALLAIGVYAAEEELLEQMRRRHYIRVLIDAYAVLRRRTGLDLPFRYNASYADREADIAAWQVALRKTRGEREAARPLDVSDAFFIQRMRAMLAWLRGQSVNYRYVAQKVVVALGSHALPFLETELRSGHAVAQRQAALMMGRIGDPRAAPALREALGLEDDDARAEALEALRLVGDRDAVPQARAALADSDPEVRAKAALLLEELGDESARDALAAALAKERSPATVAAIACALLRHGDATVIPRLLRIFVEGEQHPREAAAAALSRVALPPWDVDPNAPREVREQRAAAFRKK